MRNWWGTRRRRESPPVWRPSELPQAASSSIRASLDSSRDCHRHHGGAGLAAAVRGVPHARTVARGLPPVPTTLAQRPTGAATSGDASSCWSGTLTGAGPRRRCGQPRPHQRGPLGSPDATATWPAGAARPTSTGKPKEVSSLLRPTTILVARTGRHHRSPGNTGRTLARAGAAARHRIATATTSPLAPVGRPPGRYPTTSPPPRCAGASSTPSPRARPNGTSMRTRLCPRGPCASLRALVSMNRSRRSLAHRRSTTPAASATSRSPGAGIAREAIVADRRRPTTRPRRGSRRRTRRGTSAAPRGNWAFRRTR
jgi:hypothetical protein